MRALNDVSVKTNMVEAQLARSYSVERKAIKDVGVAMNIMLDLEKKDHVTKEKTRKQIEATAKRVRAMRQAVKDMNVDVGASLKAFAGYNSALKGSAKGMKTFERAVFENKQIIKKTREEQRKAAIESKKMRAERTKNANKVRRLVNLLKSYDIILRETTISMRLVGQADEEVMR